MNVRKRFIALLLCGCTMFGMAIPAYATSSETTSDDSGITVGELELTTVDLSGVDPSCITELPQSATLSEKESVPAPAISALDSFDVSSLDFELAVPFEGQAQNQAASVLASPSYSMSTLSDIIPTGESSKIYTIDVPSGAILQAELEVPRNVALDYNLYLLTVDDSTSQTTIASGSEYATDSNFMSETAATINQGSATKTYFILVNATGLTSDTDYFTLNVSLSPNGAYDSLEPNDSAFFAYPFPTLTSTTYVSVPGNLNSPIDNDWYVLYVDSTEDFAGLEIQNLPGYATVEAYTVTNGNEMTLRGTTEDDPVLPIVAGYNYFRISYDTNSTFTPDIYTIKFVPALTPTKVYTLIAVDGYCQRTSSLFADGIRRFLFTMGADVEVRVMYLTGDNILVKTDDTVSVEIDNPNWSADLVRYSRASATINNQNTCSVFLDVPPLRGDRYDLVYTTIRSQKFGYIANRVQMALLNKYDDGELSRPCQHNGTCGLP